MMIKILAVAFGGAAGSVLRYLIYEGMHRWSGATWPVGTLAVNVMGCLLIGFIAAAIAGTHLEEHEFRFAVIVGFLGGFTTFSAFGWDTLTLAREGGWLAAAGNIAANNGLGIVAVVLGWAAARWGMG